MLKKLFFLLNTALFIGILAVGVSHSMQSDSLMYNLMQLKANLETLMGALRVQDFQDIRQFVAELSRSSRPLPLMQRALEQVVALPPLPPRDDVILSASEIQEEEYFKDELQKLMDSYSQKGESDLLVKQLSLMITAEQHQAFMRTVVDTLKDRPLPPIPRPLPKVPSSVATQGPEKPLTLEQKKRAAAQSLMDIATVLALRRAVIAPDNDDDDDENGGEFDVNEEPVPEFVPTQTSTSGGFVPLDIVLERGSRKFFDSDEEPPSDEDEQEWD